MDLNYSIKYLLSPYITLRFSDLKGHIPKDKEKTIKVSYTCDGFPPRGILYEMFQIHIEDRTDRLNVSLRGEVKIPNLSKLEMTNYGKKFLKESHFTKQQKQLFKKQFKYFDNIQ